MDLEKEKIYLNALNLVLKDDLMGLYRLREAINSYEQIWNLKQKPKTLTPALTKILQKIQENQNEINPFEEYERLKKEGITFILKEEPSYPALLKEIAYAPLGLYLKGEPLSENLKIAVVGTRRPSYYGKRAAEEIAATLAKAQVELVAGLAWGIDTIVHKTALKYKTKTLAVLGSGLNIIYPPINKKLSEAIIKNGTLISEYPLDTPAKKYHFPLRNRIISGLCQGVVVVEAPLKSGALITAKYALEQNREVFSVPGPIFSNVSIGTNRLIQEGAKLILSARDIFDELNITSPDTKEKIETLENKTEEVIMSFFKNDEPVLIDKIIEESNFKTAEILAALTNLELKGLIKNIGGGYYVKAH